jgi:hypothetical protein
MNNSLDNLASEIVVLFSTKFLSMKRILLIACIAFAGCGAKTNEDIARELITESLKAKLPDFKDYESVNFGTMGKAFLPFEETELFVTNTKAIKTYEDSVAVLQQLINDNKTAAANTSLATYKEVVQQLQDSIKAKNELIAVTKRSYTPEELFKITHGYTLKDKTGKPVPVEEAYYFDKDFKRIVKVKKVF